MDPKLEKYFAKPWVEFCKEFGEMPMIYGPVENLPASFTKLAGRIVAKLEISPPDTSIKSEDIDCNENYKVRVYHPPGATGNDPLAIYIHGGGWSICDLDSEDAVCRVVSKTMNMVLVSVGYRLGPKYKFPAAFEDCVDAFNWTIANASKLGARDTKVVIMGGSAGGNLALGSALRLIDEGKGARIGGIVAISPVTIHPDAVPAHLKDKFTAYEENADLTLNSKDAMLAFWESYAPPPNDIYTSCLLHPRLQPLPKTYITEHGRDTLRDDARLMRDALVNSGVQVRYDDYPGYPHWSWTFPSKALSKHAEEYFGNLFAALRWILE